MIRTLTGKNSFALRQYLDERVTSMQQMGGELAIERIDASESDVDAILQAVQTLPFLVAEKLLVITSVQSNTSLMNRIEELIDRVAEGVEVLLVDQSFDKRKSSFKLLQKKTELHDFAEPNARELPKWLSHYAKDVGATLSIADATYLVERVGAHQQIVANEVSKLALYDTHITRQSIDLLTDKSIQSTIFDLLDAAFSGKHDRALALYREQRDARIEPQYIIAMMTWQLQSLALAVFAPDKSEATLINAGVSPYTAKQAIRITQSMSRTRLKEIIVGLSELDAQIKTSADADAGIELFLLGL